MAEERHVRVVRPFSPVIGAALTPSRDAALRERFQAKACPGLDPGWKPVRVKKTRQIKNLEPRFDSIETEKALVLLCHKFIRTGRAVEARQHGHRGKRLTRASMMRRRTVAIEFGTWRSGRNGGSSGSVTVGYGKLREPRGGTRS